MIAGGVRFCTRVSGILSESVFLHAVGIIHVGFGIGVTGTIVECEIGGQRRFHRGEEGMRLHAAVVDAVIVVIKRADRELHHQRAHTSESADGVAGGLELITVVFVTRHQKIGFAELPVRLKGEAVLIGFIVCIVVNRKRHVGACNVVEHVFGALLVEHVGSYAGEVLTEVSEIGKKPDLVTLPFRNVH